MGLDAASSTGAAGSTQHGTLTMPLPRPVVVNRIGQHRRLNRHDLHARVTATHQLVADAERARPADKVEDVSVARRDHALELDAWILGVRRLDLGAQALPPYLRVVPRVHQVAVRLQGVQLITGHHLGKDEVTIAPQGGEVEQRRDVRRRWRHRQRSAGAGHRRRYRPGTVLPHTAGTPG